jgi:hypothetical protein
LSTSETASGLDVHDCKDTWKSRRPQPSRDAWARRQLWEGLSIGLCERELGDIWQQPLLLEPGSSAETSLVVRSPLDADVLQVFSSIVYGYADRFERTPQPQHLAIQQACPVLPGDDTDDQLQTYQRGAFDPLTGLIEAWDPRYVQVIDGATDSGQRRAQLCELNRGRVRGGLDQTDRLLGRHEAVNQFLFSTTPS